jgi:hypothetical protein
MLLGRMVHTFDYPLRGTCLRRQSSTPGVATTHQQLRPAVKVALRKNGQPGWQPERGSYGTNIAVACPTPSKSATIC